MFENNETGWMNTGYVFKIPLETVTVFETIFERKRKKDIFMCRGK